MVSIYLRCSAGKIIWNYPRGAVRVLLRSPMSLQNNFRACIKLHNNQTGADGSGHHQNHHHQNHKYKKLNHNILNDLNKLNSIDNKSRRNSRRNNKNARIFLEAPKRLISLYDDDDEVVVKCFRSINEQVALYIEAEGMCI